MSPVFKESVTLKFALPMVAKLHNDDDGSVAGTYEYLSNIFLPTFQTPRVISRTCGRSQVDELVNWKITSPGIVWSLDDAYDSCVTIPDESQINKFDILSRNSLEFVKLLPRFSSKAGSTVRLRKKMCEISDLDAIHELECSYSIIHYLYFTQSVNKGNRK
jgi:hypothetical protein